MTVIISVILIIMGQSMTTRSRQLVILDIDGTLIYARTGKADAPLTSDEFLIEDDNEVYIVRKRPHVIPFLKWCFEHFHVAFWSASPQLYVNAIVHQLLLDLSDGDSEAIQVHQPDFIWHSHHCRRSSSGYYVSSYNNYIIKPLYLVWPMGPWDVENTWIVDDTPTTYMYNLENAIPIRSFSGRASDDDLLRVQKILEEKLA